MERSPAVKRLMREAQELKDATSEYSASPLEDNLFEWHFTFRGPEGSDFHGGIYHGRILLPPEYPMKPPSIMLLNHNGRFEVHKKICLSISGYHPESWQPSWSIRTAILAIIGFMPTKGDGAIGALDYTAEERKKLARKSQSFSCTSCGSIQDLLAKSLSENHSESEKRDRELAKQILFAKPKPTKPSPEKSETSNPSENSDPTSATQTRESVTADDGDASAPLQEENNGQANSEGVRQRIQAASVQENITQPSAPVRNEPLPQTSQRQNDTASLVLVVVLSVAIALLFFRRLDRVLNISSGLDG
ncbi:unnamed protein product [Clavelina lepadiformis]|uniref:UBC core domain-containing protein n=1 Tax=Clavelina lepadiformis TaxID=159417 RepID=A0ABP0GBQ6_CLALP